MAKNTPTAAVLVPPSILRGVATRVSSPSLTLLATSLFLLFAVRACAMPLRYSLELLARTSDMIVVARVESIQGSRVTGKRWATARIREVWKGPKAETVRFLASRRRESWSVLISGCYDPDITDAKKGEVVVLFLANEKNVGWVVLNKGRGRLPLITRNGKEYLTYPPCELRKIDIPDEHSGSIPAAELSTLRAFVQKVAQNTV
jgi:hypothetical protein